MTVADLVVALLKCNPNAEVQVNLNRPEPNYLLDITSVIDIAPNNVVELEARDDNARPLHLFCVEEAEYRVLECEYGLTGKTIAEVLRNQDIDVDEFVSNYAERLYDKAEYWIEGDTIQSCLDELLKDYEIE